MQALVLAVTLVGWSFAGPRIPARSRLPLQAGLGGLLVLATRAPVGLRPPRLWSGLRLGLAVGSPAAAAVAVTTSVPAVRLSMAERQLPASALSWLAVRIPLGTVWAEEAAFRAALAIQRRSHVRRRVLPLSSVTSGLRVCADGIERDSWA